MLNRLKISDENLRHAQEFGCAVAVSGGSDSMALLCLLHEAKAKIHALTIDHGLREQAKLEARFVAAFCARLGVPHEIIPVHVGLGNMQAEARKARYDALQNWCAANGIGMIAFGHTADDQAETFLMNAMRGSGVDGLAAMNEARVNEAHMNQEWGRVVKIIRPLLYIRRRELRAYLSKREVKWVDDPSNDDLKFDRVKLRRWIKDGEQLGLDMSGLPRTIGNMQRARDYLQEKSHAWIKENTRFSPFHVEVQMDRQLIIELDREIAFRVLAYFCRYFGGGNYRPRQDGIEKLFVSLESEAGGMALAHTDFHWSKKRVRICSEVAFLPEPSNTQSWHRYHLRHKRKKGERFDGLRDDSSSHDFWRDWGISARAAKAIPVLRKEKEITPLAQDDVELISY